MQAAKWRTLVKSLLVIGMIIGLADAGGCALNKLNDIGFSYYNGDGKPQIPETAIRYWTIAGNLGYAKSQYNLGHAYQDGKGVERNLGKALYWMQKAASQGYVEAENSLGRVYEAGADYPQAFEWYHKAADHGFTMAQNNLGAMYQNGWGVKQDYKEALKWYRLAAKTEPLAAYNIGVMYDNGFGVPEDYIAAMKWYRLAADVGLPGAQFAVGALYIQGHGMNADVARAIDWWERAGNNDFVPAQLQLAKYYYSGKDYAEALKWYRKAADLGDSTAQYSVGLFYQYGLGVEKNPVVAEQWMRLAKQQTGAASITDARKPAGRGFNELEKSADAGYDLAQYLLGMTYLKGGPVERDRVKAYQWLLLAGSSGTPGKMNAEAMDQLKEIEPLMTHEQIDEARQRASQWRKAHRQ